MDNFPKLKNDLFIRMCYNEEVIKEVPVWIMRQAGRYLPEFREIRKNHDFFEICENPELASEVTLMPIKRFRLDAAIIFSDILVIPKALGMHIKMVEKVGPVIEDPIRNAEDFEKFYKLERMEIHKKLRHVGEALHLTRTKLDGCVPLIGFSGGPWTLLAYMIEGGGSKTFSNAKKWLYCNVIETKNALRFLSELIVSYLQMQIENGAQALQLFESCAEYLSPYHFRSFLMPELHFIFSNLKQFILERSLKVPLILFAKGCYHSIEEQDKLDIQVIGIDWTVKGKEARTKTKKTLQGNLDPPALYTKDADFLETIVTEMLHDFNSLEKETEKSISGYIANLGHGIYPDTPVENVERFINVVHSFKRN